MKYAPPELPPGNRPGYSPPPGRRTQEAEYMKNQNQSAKSKIIDGKQTIIVKTKTTVSNASIISPPL